MEGALGIIEIRGLASAITVADVMAKTAAVKLLEIEPAKGGGWMTIKITGNVAAVGAAVGAGKQVGESYGAYVSSKVIPRPAAEVSALFCKAQTAGAPASPPGGRPEPAAAAPEITAEDAKKPAITVKAAEENASGPVPPIQAAEQAAAPQTKTTSAKQPAAAANTHQAKASAPIPPIQAAAKAPETETVAAIEPQAAVRNEAAKAPAPKPDRKPSAAAQPAGSKKKETASKKTTARITDEPETGKNQTAKGVAGQTGS